jgi:hypothetical protein
LNKRNNCLTKFKYKIPQNLVDEARQVQLFSASRNQDNTSALVGKRPTHTSFSFIIKLGRAKTGVYNWISSTVLT